MSRRYEQGERFPVGEEFQLALDRPSLAFSQVTAGQKVEIVYKYDSMRDEENTGRLLVASTSTPQKGEPGHGFIQGTITGRKLDENNEPTDTEVSIVVSVVNSSIHSI